MNVKRVYKNPFVLFVIGLLGAGLCYFFLAELLSFSPTHTSYPQWSHIWWLNALVISFIVWMMRAIRVRLICPNASFKVALSAVATQNFLIRITPLRLGELGLPYFLKKYGNYFSLTLGARIVGKMAKFLRISLF